MRLEKNKDGTYSVWLSREEYRKYVRGIDEWRHEIAVRLMGDCGLRREETLNVRYEDVKRYSDGEHFKLHVRGAKDTSGEYHNGKERETWLPRDLERELYRYSDREGISDDEPIISVGKRQVSNWIDAINGNIAEETGNTDWLKVSSHDFRRQWAHHLLVEEKVNPRIMMELGGWSSYDAIEPYLNKPSEENIIQSMTNVGL